MIYQTSGGAVSLTSFPITSTGDEMSATAGKTFAVVQMSVVNGPIDNVVHDAHRRQGKERVEDECQRIDINLKNSV